MKTLSKLYDHFIGTPLRRSGPHKLKRNAAIVLGNIGDPSGRKALEFGASHSNSNIRDHARWALQQIG